MLDHVEYMPNTFQIQEESLSEMFDENVASGREQQYQHLISISDIPTNFQMRPFPFEQFKGNQEFSYVSRTSEYDNINDEEENSSCTASELLERTRSSIEQEKNNLISCLRSAVKDVPSQKQKKRFNLYSDYNSISSFEPTSEYSSEE